MATYTMYWPNWICDGVRERGLEGQVLRVLWGGYNHDTLFSRFKVGPGDTVVPVTVVDGVLFALGSLVVEEKEKVTKRWLASHPAEVAHRIHSCSSEVLIGSGQGVPLRFDRAFSGKQLESWRYDSAAAGRPLKFLEEGRLTKTLSLQGVYRVSPATALLIAAVLEATTPEAPRSSAADLEASLRASPGDENTAWVLADAWQNSGDTRGEILALELRLAREKDAQNAAEMDRRHAALMRTAVSLKKTPGGFPYRMLMGRRPSLDLSATLRLAGKDKAAVLLAFHGLVAQLLDVEGFTALELLNWHRTTPPSQLDRCFVQAGARRAAFRTTRWTRRKAFSTEETMSITGDEVAYLVEATGALRGSDGVPLPFHTKSQWLGPAPRNELRLRLAEHTVSASVHVPLGSPLADIRAAELKKLFRTLR